MFLLFGALVFFPSMNACALFLISFAHCAVSKHSGCFRSVFSRFAHQFYDEDVDGDDYYFFYSFFICFINDSFIVFLLMFASNFHEMLSCELYIHVFHCMTQAFSIMKECKRNYIVIRSMFSLDALLLHVVPSCTANVKSIEMWIHLIFITHCSVVDFCSNRM